MFGILVALLVLGVLITVHELGHLLVAKWTGIAVDAFSVGFGPELWAFEFKGTRYRVALIPLGGYCKMRGENNSVTTGEEEQVLDPAALYNRPAWARLLTVLAGVTFNTVFAILILAGIALVGYEEEQLSPVVYVAESDPPSLAFAAGMRTGDRIVELDGQPVQSFQQIVEPIALSIGKTLLLRYERGGQVYSGRIQPTLSPETGVGSIGVSPVMTNEIQAVVSNSPAQQAGLRAKDILIAVDGESVRYFSDLSRHILDKGTNLIQVRVLRDGEPMEFPVTPRMDADGQARIGVRSAGYVHETVVVESKGFFGSLAYGVRESVRILQNTAAGLGAMVTGKIDARKNLAGPIRIVQVVGQVAERNNLVVLMRFVALISLALAFFNLLPLPGLDGGHAVFAFVEMCTGKRPPDKFLGVMENLGLAVLLSLAVLVMANDLFNIGREILQK